MTPVFDEMMNQKLIPNNMFAFYLTSKQAEGMGMPSDLTFGFYDRSKFKGDIDWHPVDYQYMFGVKLDDILFNGKSSGVCADRSNGCLITFDSGTSLMSVPSFATKKLVKAKIPTSNFIQPCQNKEQFGDMTLVINGKNYVVPNDEWMLPQQTLSMAQTQAKLKTTLKMGPLGPQLMAQTNSEVSLGSEEEHKPDQDVHLQTEVDADRHNKKTPQGGANIKPGDTACASTIMNMDLSKDMFLVGDVFMRRYYTIFDRDNNRVGIAQAVTNDKIKLASQGGL